MVWEAVVSAASVVVGMGLRRGRRTAYASTCSQGEGRDDGFGYAIVSGDYNADGERDLAVSAPLLSTQQPGQSADVLRQGKLYAYDGHSSGLPSATPDWEAWNGNYDAWLGSDLATQHTAAFDSLLVAAMRYNNGRGNIYHYQGTGAGLEDDWDWQVLSSGNIPNEADSYVGSSVYSADVYGNDGIEDLILGQLYSEDDRGEISVFRNCVPTGSFWREEGPNNARSWFSMYGKAVVGCNLDGDLGADAIVGWPRGYSAGGVAYGGEVHVHRDEGGGIDNSPTAIVYGNMNIGSMFGWSLACAGDVNGDGYDDLLVGAPMYTSPTAVRDFEAGMVHIFYGSTGSISDADSWQYAGHDPYGRLGYSVSAIGDLNRDGYDDFVAGAPWAGDDHRGRVYVFYGGKDGPGTEPDQILDGDEAMGLFGFAVHGHKDLDMNADLYPDLYVSSLNGSSGNGNVRLFYGQKIADLEITLSAANDTLVVAPGIVELSFVFHNYGPSDAAATATANIAIPSTVTVHSWTGLGCSLTGSVLSCSIASLGAGFNSSLQVVLAVGPTALGSITVTTTLDSGDVFDPTPASSMLIFAAESIVDLYFTRFSIDPLLYAGDSDETIFVQVVNNGPSHAINTRIDVLLPDDRIGLVEKQVVAPDGSAECLGFLFCPIGVLPAGESATVQITFRILSSSPAGLLPINATISTDSDDTVPANNAVSNVTMVRKRADVSVVLDVYPLSAAAGSEMQWQVKLSNQGPSDAENVGMLVDLDPAVVTITNVSPEPPLVCIPAVGGRIVCNMTDLVAGGNPEVIISVNLLPDAPAGDIPGGSAWIFSGTDDTILSNNAHLDVEFNVFQRADLSVVAITDHAVGAVLVDEVVTTTYQVYNKGPSLVDSTQFNISYDGCLDLSAGPNVTVPGVCGPPVGSGVAGTPMVLECSAALFSPSTTVSLSVVISTTVTWRCEAQPLLSFAITASHSGVDPTNANNQDSVAVSTNMNADVHMALTASPVPVAAGGLLDLRFVFIVLGPNPTDGLRLDIALAGEPAFDFSITQALAAPQPGACGPVVQINTTHGVPLATVTCLMGSLLAGEAATASVKVRAPTYVTDGSRLNVTSVVSSIRPDPTPLGNTKTLSVLVEVVSNLRVGFAGSPDPVAGGTLLTYTGTITNDGSSVAPNVRAVATLDQTKAEFVSTTTNCTYEAATGVVTCPIGSMNVFQTERVLFVVRVNSTLTSGYLNQTLTVLTDARDPILDNNVGMWPARLVLAVTDLSVSAATTSGGVPVTSVFAGDTLTYSFGISNTGSASQPDVRLEFTLPLGVEVTQQAGTCAEIGGGKVECTLGTIAQQGGVASAYVTLRVLSNTTAPLDAIARVYSASPDAVFDENPANDQISTHTGVTFGANLRAEILVAPGFVTVGSGLPPDTVWSSSIVSYTVSLTNTGPSAASSVAWEIVLPGTDQVSLVAIPAQYGEGMATSCVVVESLPAATTLLCTIFNLGAPGVRTLQLGARVMARYEGPLTPASTNVSALTNDYDLDDNDAVSGPMAAISQSDLSMNIFSTPSGQLYASGVLTWAVTLTNNGPSEAYDVVWTIDLPHVDQWSASAPVPTLDTRGFPVNCSDFVELSDRTQVICTFAIMTTYDINGQSGQYWSTVIFQGTVDSTFEGALATSSNVTSGSTDPAIANNGAVLSRDATKSADLFVAIEVYPPTAVFASTSVTYTASVSNAGLSASTGVDWLIYLPGTDALTLDPLPTQDAYGNTVNCTSAPTPALTVISCPIPVMYTPGGGVYSLRVRFSGLLADRLSSTLVADVNATSPSTFDPNLANNHATVPLDVITRADVYAAASSSPQLALYAGGPIQYSFSATNNGPSLAENVLFSINLPGTDLFMLDPQFRSGKLNDTDGEPLNCTLTENPAVTHLLCFLGLFGTVSVNPPAYTRTLALAGETSLRAGGLLIADANVSSTTQDLNTANNRVQLSVLDLWSADVFVGMEALPIDGSLAVGQAVTGDELAISVTVSNSGPSVATSLGWVIVMPGTATFTLNALPTNDTQGRDLNCTAQISPALTVVTCWRDELWSPALGAGVFSVTMELQGELSPSWEGQWVATVNATSSTPDSNTGNNQKEVALDVRWMGDLLVIASSASGQIVIPPNTVFFSSIVANAGPSNAENITWRIVLPGSDVALDPCAFVLNQVPTNDTLGRALDCALEGPTALSTNISCSLAILDNSGGPGGTVEVSISGSVGPRCDGPITVHASAFSQATYDPNPGTNTASATVTGYWLADLGVDVGVSPALTVVAGSKVTFTPNLLNGGPSVADAIVWNMTITPGPPTAVLEPAGVPLVDQELKPLNCTMLQEDATGTRLQCAFDTMGTPSLGGRFVSTALLGVRLAATFDGTLSIDTRADSLTFDPISSNNVQAKAVTVVAEGDVFATLKAVRPAVVYSGQRVTYSLAVGNSGPTPSLNVSVNTTLPGLNAWSLDALPANDTDGNPVDCTLTQGMLVTRLVCFYAQLGTPSGSYGPYRSTLILPGSVDGEFEGSINAHVAAVSSFTRDPYLSNNEATVQFTVTQQADLLVSLAVTPSSRTVNAGGTVTLTMQVANGGPSPAPNVVWLLEMPGTDTWAIEDFPANDTNDQPLDCITTETELLTTVSCSFVQLSSPSLGGTYYSLVHIVVRAGDRAQGSFPFTTRVSSSAPDPTPANDVATFNVTSTADADLTVSLDALPTSGVYAGNVLSFVATLSNGGPSLAFDVLWKTTLPPESEFKMIPETAPTVDANGVPLFCFVTRTPVNQTVTCSLAQLSTPKFGGYYSLRLVLQGLVVPTFSGQVTAWTEGISQTNDPKASNSIVSSTVSSSLRADLTVGLSSASDYDPRRVSLPLETAFTHRGILYSAVISNPGPSALSGITWRLSLPGTTWLTASAPTEDDAGNPLSCSYSDSPMVTNITCTLAAVSTPAYPEGGPYFVAYTLLAQVKATADGLNLVATAEAETGGFDISPGNNVAQVSNPVTTTADLVASVTATKGTASSLPPDEVYAGSPVVFTTTISNGGPSRATDAALILTLPGTALFTLNALPANDTLGAPLNCNVTAAPAQTIVRCLYDMGTRALGGQYTSSFSAVGTLADSTYSGAINVQAEATSVGALSNDPMPANNIDTAGLTSIWATDLTSGATAQALHAAMGEVWGGGLAVFSCAIANAGPGSALDVQIHLSLPPPSVATLVGGLPTNDSVGTWVGCTELGHDAFELRVLCTVDSLNTPWSGMQYKTLINFVFLVDEAYSGIVAINVNASCPLTGEIAPANNLASASLDSRTESDLKVSLSVIPLTVSGAAPPDGMIWEEVSVIYTLLLTNLGPTASLNSTITFNLPPDSLFEAAPGSVGMLTDTVGDPLSCSEQSTAAMLTITCLVPRLASPTSVFAGGGAYALPLSIPGTIAHGAAGANMTTSALAVEGNAPDPILSNNNATLTVGVLPPEADLSITVQGPIDEVKGGSSAFFQAFILSAGPTVARRINITVHFDGSKVKEFLIVEFPGECQGMPAGGFVCAITDPLQPLDAETLLFSLTFLESASGWCNTTLVVSSDVAFDADLDNNEAMAPVTVVALPKKEPSTTEDPDKLVLLGVGVEPWMGAVAGGIVALLLIVLLALLGFFRRKRPPKFETSVIKRKQDADELDADADALEMQVAAAAGEAGEEADVWGGGMTEAEPTEKAQEWEDEEDA